MHIEQLSRVGFCWLLILALSLAATGCLRKTYGQARRGMRAPEAARGTSGHQAMSLQVEGRQRTFQVYVPPTYDAKTPAPLLLVFHGRGGNGERIARTTQFDGLAKTEGILVAYPDGYEQTWNDGRGDTKAERAGVNDVAFVAALIDHLTRAFNVDRGRIYATGFSNGGILTQRLGCELSERLVAIAPVVGPLTPAVASRCRPTRGISVLGIYGTKDPLNPWEGGEITKGGRGGILSVPATMDLWGNLNGCRKPQSRSPMAEKVHDGTRVWQESYLGCQGGTKVVLYGVEGMGHNWPPRTPSFERITGPTSGNIDASQVIWNFLKSVPSRGL